MSDDATTVPMYTLQKVMGRKINASAIMDQLDAGDISLLELSQHYYDVYFIINVRIYNSPRVLYFKDLPIGIQISSMSINQYLKKVGNRNLRLSEELPQHVRGEVYSWDVHSWQFDYKAMKLGVHHKANIPEEDKEDLKLRKEGLDHSFAGKHSMVAINGFFHYHDWGDSGWIVHGGNKTKNKYKDSTHINILDFTQVGEITLHRITDDMILKNDGGKPLNDGFYIDAKHTLANKTIGICIGGYFHLLDNTYKKVSDRMIKVLFQNIQWETLYYQMKQYLNVSSLPLTDFGNDRVVGFELYHDETIKALLKLPQSFLVFIHNPHVTVIEEQIGHTGIPGRYETADKPIHPVRVGEGRYPAYKAIKNIDKWSIAIDKNIVPLQVRYQKQKDEFSIIHNRQHPINGSVYATAHFVRIISDRDMKTKDLDGWFDTFNHDLGSLKPFMSSMNVENIDYQLDGREQFYKPEKLINEDFESEYYYPISTGVDNG